MSDAARPPQELLASVADEPPQAVAVRAQGLAIDPTKSAWAQANAGSGKTKVLTDRMMRLLLAGVRPDTILCLTFTRAAAAEMRNRLSARLGRWTSISDDELREELAGLLMRAPEPIEGIRARRLFAAALDAPGGMKVLTIHAFCQSLLRRFPLEAGVPPGLAVLDESQAGELLRDALDEQLEDIDAGRASPELRDALDAATRWVGADAYVKTLHAMLGQRGRLARLRADPGVEAAIAALRREMGLKPGDDADSLLAAACAGAAFDRRALKQCLAALGKGGANDAKAAAVLAPWLAADDAGRRALFEDWLGALTTTDKETGGLRAKKVGSKGAVAAMADVCDRLDEEAARLIAADDRIRAARLAEASAGLLRLSMDVAVRYERGKRERAALDYDDLVLKTEALLSRGAAAAWVLYKLDAGLDHILVDEAQDTNPDQWRVVRALAEEFFSGAGAREAGDSPRPRTVFVVGDEKQSIFSFQRADRAELKRMKEYLVEREKAAGRDLIDSPLKVSFRSAAAVLDAVDGTFAAPAARDGVSDDPIVHISNRAAAPGLVEVWPAVPKPPRKAKAAAGEDGDGAGDDSGADPDEESAPNHTRLARYVAAHLKKLIDARTPLDAVKGRAMHAGDAMVLVRTRNDFIDALVGELKRLDVPVAGVDRIELMDELAVKDLLALAQVALLPHDDLTLAALLKGPLVGMTEAQLRAVAAGRVGSLIAALRAAARAGDAAAAHALATVDDAMARADLQTPFDFFADTLSRRQARTRLLGRLGREAADPVDELLRLALQYQASEAPSLQGFLRWLELGAGEIKRDLDENRRPELRILTVHASKGLQAPVVYLPDTCTRPQMDATLFWGADAAAPLWVPTAELRDSTARRLRQESQRKAMEEHRRLLYVAMTRAQDRLYVGGWLGKTAAGYDDSWHSAIAAALGANARPAREDRTAIEGARRPVTKTPFDAGSLIGAADGWKGDMLSIESGAPLAAPPATAALASPAKPPQPAWLRAAPAAEPTPPRPLAPSQPDPPPGADIADRASAVDGLHPEPAALSPLAEGDAQRWFRGNMIHRLLQLLPDVAPEKRADAATRFLAQPGHGLAATQQAAWAKEALAVLALPEAQALFGPGSRAEVPLSGLVDTAGGPRAVSGQIDRLAVEPGRVAIVDYKTNRPPPRTVEDVPLLYRRQMALYRALLRRVFPDREISAYLLWTDGPRLMELPPALLDAATPA